MGQGGQQPSTLPSQSAIRENDGKDASFRANLYVVIARHVGKIPGQTFHPFSPCEISSPNISIRYNSSKLIIISTGIWEVPEKIIWKRFLYPYTVTNEIQ